MAPPSSPPPQPPAIAITAGNLLLASLAGYSLCKFRYFGRGALFLMILSTMMLPLEVTMVPLFLIVKTLEWPNTYEGLIVPFLVDGFVAGTFEALREGLEAGLFNVPDVELAAYDLLLLAHAWALKHWYFERTLSLDTYAQRQLALVLNGIIEPRHRRKYADAPVGPQQGFVFRRLRASRNAPSAVWYGSVVTSFW